MLGTFKRAADVLDLTAQVLTIDARLALVQTAVPGCAARVNEYGSIRMRLKRRSS